jgi:dissimilatory sulfite reductase (desulfoviridin) alpha/beta subunit
MPAEKKSTAVDLKNLKAGGFIKEREKDLFTVRLRVPGGRLTVERLKKIARRGWCISPSVNRSS